MRQQRIRSSRLITDIQKDRRSHCGPPVFFMPLGGQDCHHADNGPAWGRGGGGGYLPVGYSGQRIGKEVWELVRREAATIASAPLPEENALGRAHKISFSQYRGPSPIFQKAASTSRASCLRARTRNSGVLRRPGPSRSPSRPARRQSPRRRAAARKGKARAWAGWRTADAS